MVMDSQDIQDQERCEWCNTLINREEYMINFGICNKCMDDSWKKYLTEIGINPKLPHEEIEILLHDHYNKMIEREKNRNEK